MCGIFGITNYHNLALDTKLVTESSKLMQHRGPDAFGQWGIKNKIELAHLRLSIIDLDSSSNQPFFSDCQNYVLVFNGEIYNYLEIKSELKLKGYSFRTSSDTEVLLKSYIEWKEECVTRFNGDWAFSIYDIKNDKLFCSRDRYGVKPFNYAMVDGNLIFSSEIKSIINYFPSLKRPNYNVISNFCRNSLGAQNEETWFSQIKRLLPGHNLIFQNGKIIIKKFWDYPTKTQNVSFDSAKEEYKNILTSAVNLRMRSDVPVGTTLSSGLDSSSIVSILRKFYNDEHKTFTATFNKDEYQDTEKNIYKDDINIQESDLVKKLSEDLNLKSFFIKALDEDFINLLKRNIYHLESGHSSPAINPLSNTLDFAKDHVTVVMEGQGADELLGGYISNFFIFYLIDSIKANNITKALNDINKFGENYSLPYSFKLFIRLLNNKYIENIYHNFNGYNKVLGEKLNNNYSRIKDYNIENNNFSEKLNGALYKSHTGGLVSLLHYGDAISMSKSMESRNPFVDVNLVEYAFTLPYNYKINNGRGKYIHRKSMEKIVPDYILDNPLKFGFNTPLSRHFCKIDSPANKILLSEQCLERKIFNSNGIKKMIRNQVEKKNDNSQFLFRLLSVELWFRKFID